MEHSKKVVKATEVINVAVKNPANEDLGKIVDIMLDRNIGKANYAVLSFDRFFGFDTKLFAVPWEPLHYEKDKNCFVLNVSRESLKDAPGFDKDAWPDFAEPAWGESIRSFYHKAAESVLD